jgi:hypothetical protein
VRSKEEILEELRRERLDDLVWPPPQPTECPDCGSRSFVPILYGLPAPGMTEQERGGKFVMGGCSLGTPRWYCKDCLNRWPEDPPRQASYGDRQKKYLDQTVAEYASLIATAELPPSADEPTVEKFWQRPDGRMVFLLNCPWGKTRIEKQSHLVPLGGAPIYELTEGWLPAMESGNERQAALAAMRFERSPRT